MSVCVCVYVCVCVVCVCVLCVCVRACVWGGGFEDVGAGYLLEMLKIARPCRTLQLFDEELLVYQPVPETRIFVEVLHINGLNDMTEGFSQKDGVPA